MKRIIVLFCLVSVCFTCISCTAASTVNHNINQSADNFEILRKVTVYNARTDLIVFEIEGYMSLSNNYTDELVVTCKVGPDLFKKNYIYLNEFVIYVVEDISGTHTDPYHYKVHFYTPSLDVDLNK